MRVDELIGLKRRQSRRQKALGCRFVLREPIQSEHNNALATGSLHQVTGNIMERIKNCETACSWPEEERKEMLALYLSDSI